MPGITRTFVARERREYIQSPMLGGVELLAAEYRQHVFPRHVQDQVVIGLVEAGHIQFTGGGIDAAVGEGEILFIAPGAVHEALGHGDGAWTYRALYLTPEQWAAACSTLGAPVPTGASVLRDERLYEHTRRAHQHLVSGTLTERQFAVTVRTLVDAVASHESATRGTPAPCVDQALARVRATLDGATGRRMTLGEMAALAGLSRFHFLRAFTRAYGVSPYAYALDRRLREARRRLAAGAPISMTAFDVGFADQAHLTRHFLRTVGVTPGEYQRAFA